MLLQMALFRSFQWLSDTPLYRMYHIFTHSSADGHSDMPPLLGYCKQFRSEHWRSRIFSDHVFLWIHAQEWDCRVIWLRSF